MGRCKECDSCAAVIKFKARHKSKSDRKKVKRFENTKLCPFAAGHGVEIRGEIQPIPSIDEVALDPAAREARPKGSLAEENAFDANAFDGYVDVVRRCTNAAKGSSSADVKLEGRTMILKMRGLLEPSMKSEVDYDEATRDCGNIFVKWINGDAAGTNSRCANVVSYSTQTASVWTS